MRSQLTTSQSKKKLADYLTIVAKKKRLKEENQRRKSVSVLPQPQSIRKPLRPSNLNNTQVAKSTTNLNTQVARSTTNLNTQVARSTTNLNTTVTLSKPSLNTTVTVKKSRKPSLELSSCPPWYVDSLPRYHEDPVNAVTSLNLMLGI